MATSFSTIPVIDFARLSSPTQKVETLQQLKTALFEVGFLYLVNTGLEVYQPLRSAAPTNFL